MHDVNEKKCARKFINKYELTAYDMEDKVRSFFFQ